MPHSRSDSGWASSGAVVTVRAWSATAKTPPMSPAFSAASAAATSISSAAVGSLSARNSAPSRRVTTAWFSSPARNCVYPRTAAARPETARSPAPCSARPAHSKAHSGRPAARAASPASTSRRPRTTTSGDNSPARCNAAAAAAKPLEPGPLGRSRQIVGHLRIRADTRLRSMPTPLVSMLIADQDLGKSQVHDPTPGKRSRSKHRRANQRMPETHRAGLDLHQPASSSSSAWSGTFSRCAAANTGSTARPAPRRDDE